MNKTVLMALATAVTLFGAMPSATPTAPALATAEAALVREAAVVCGGNGCGPVQTSAKHKRKFIPLGHG